MAPAERSRPTTSRRTHAPSDCHPPRHRDPPAGNPSRQAVGLRLTRRPRRMPPVAIITGSGGLIGSESVRHFVESGFDVVGLENDMRARFFGVLASTASTTQRLLEAYPEAFRSIELDIRDRGGVDRVFARAGAKIELVIHTAAQP